MTKTEMEAVMHKAVAEWQKVGYLIPVPVIRACLWMHLNEPVAGPSIYDRVMQTYGKIPEKARGWFIRRLMEIGKEVFGNEGCQRVASR